MELELNGTKLCVYGDGRIERFGKKRWNSQEFTWNELKGYIYTDKKDGYMSHKIKINKKVYKTSRIIYLANNPDWDINDSSKNNTIDHINRDSLDNRISNLRVATMAEQNLNKECVINAKGYCFDKGKWRASIKINGKRIHLGYFEKEEDASIAYQTAKNKLNPV